jgi:hypothetical protein
MEECGPCPFFASFTLAFTLQMRKNQGKTSVRVVEEFSSREEGSRCRLLERILMFI